MHSGQLTRKCAVCGQVKPLSSFLLPGNAYGNVCLDCRTAGSDDTDSTSKGSRVDDRAKNIAELEQKKRLKELKELQREHLEKTEKLAAEKKESKKFIETSEKKHREQYFDIKKALQTPIDKKKAIADAQKNKMEIDLSDNQQFQEAGIQKEASEKTEQVKTGVDFATPFNAPQISQIKFQSARFREFMQRLGTSAAGSKALETPYSQKSEAAKASVVKADEKKNIEETKATPEQPAKTTQPTQEHKVEPPKQPDHLTHRVSFIAPPPRTQVDKPAQPAVVERVEKTWGPSRKL